MDQRLSEISTIWSVLHQAHAGWTQTGFRTGTARITTWAIMRGPNHTQARRLPFAQLLRSENRVGALHADHKAKRWRLVCVIAMGGRRMKQWVVVPAAMLKSGRALRLWLGRALAHGRSLPAKA